MAKTVTDAIAQLQTMARGMTGIKEAPEAATEAASQYPFVISYPDQGDFQFQTKGWGVGIHRLITEFHFSRQSLPAAITKSLPYFEIFVDLLLADVSLNNTVESVNSVNYRFGQLEYSGVKTLGWIFTLTVKIPRSV